MQLRGRILRVYKAKERIDILVRQQDIYWSPFQVVCPQIANAIETGTAVGISVSFETSSSRLAFAVKATETISFTLDNAALDVVNEIAQILNATFANDYQSVEPGVLKVDFVMNGHTVKAKVSWKSEPEHIIRYLNNKCPDAFWK